jgi:hypothetical protein
LRVHTQADYSSGFEEGSSKAAANIRGGLSSLVRTETDVGSDERGKAMSRVGRHVLNPQSELVLISPGH